jgi:hypothetical protein
LSKNKVLAVFVVLGVIASIYIPKILCPLNELDGAWYFSQAASIINGDFIFNNFTNSSTPLLYGWVQAPIALVFQTSFSVIFFYTLAILLLGLFLINKIDHKNLLLLIPLLLVTDKSLLTNRPEIVSVLLALVLFIAWNRIKGRSYQVFFGILFSLLLIVIHPANGILAISGILAYHSLLIPKNKRLLVIYSIIGLVSVFALFFLESNVFKDVLIYRIQNYQFKYIYKFVAFSAFSIGALIYITKSTWNRWKWLNFLGLITLCAILGGSYYFTFLFIPLLLNVLNEKDKLRWSPLLWIAVLFNVLANVVHPLYAHQENREYCTQINTIYHEVSNNYNIDQKVFLESYFATSQYFNNKSARMILIDNVRVQPFDKIESSDLILMTNSNKLARLEGYLRNNNLEYSSATHIKPVKGLLSLQSAYTRRTDSLGLWVYKIK